MTEEEQRRWLTVKQQLIQARMVRALWRGEVAEALGFSRSTLQMDETHPEKRIPQQRLELYAEYYGWSLSQVLDFLGEGSREVTVKAARQDFVTLVHATEDLVQGERERATLRQAYATVVAARYGVMKSEFDAKVHRASLRRQ